MIVKPFDKPESQFCQLHNSIFDVIMHRLTSNEWKVLCAIFRKTRGWDKFEDDISYSQILGLTGIGSRSTISKALQGLIQKNMVVAIISTGVTTHYILNTSYTIDLTSPENGLVDDREGDQSNYWTGTSTENGLPTSPENGLTKDIKSLNKERLKEGSTYLKELIKLFNLDLRSQFSTSHGRFEKRMVETLKRCRPDYNGDGILILRTPNENDRNWLNSLAELIKRHLRSISGKEIIVKFETLGKEG